MPKPLSVSIVTRRLADDTLVVDVKIRNERRTLGLPEADNGGSTAGPFSDSLTVREAATDYVESLSRYENPNTASTYRSPVVKHLLPVLAFVDDERTVDRVLADADEALMLRFVATKQAERATPQASLRRSPSSTATSAAIRSCSGNSSRPRSGAWCCR